MKRISVSVLVLVLSTASITQVHADDAMGNYESVGDVPCETWMADRKAGGWDLVADQFWVAGYLTAYNAWRTGVWEILGDGNIDSVSLWLDKYCESNPDTKISDGMYLLMEELWSGRTASKPVPEN